MTFADFLAKFEQFGKGEWITAYSGRGDDIDGPVFYSALIAEDQVTQSLEDPSWDLLIGDGLPGFSSRFENGKEISSYFRYDDGIEPLVIRRNFHGLRPSYWEISEEFRFYWNLCEDHRNNKFLLITDNGDEEEAILVSPNEIKIKSRLIREFLAAKQMRLALFFDFNRFSDKTIEELGGTKIHDRRKGDDFVYSIGLQPWIGTSRENQKSHGFLMGKKLISGLKDFRPGFSSRHEKKFVDFIIGTDDEGKETIHTCDEEKLANFFGKNPGAPQYITPVFFKKNVLTKYYSQPGKYSVEDGYVRCGGLWGLRMDNNHPDSVMVFLGDLGHLAYEEQLHWRSFNVRSGKMSRTAFERSIEGKFTDPDSPDLFFKQRLDTFQVNWEKKFGWKLFKPMSEGDEYHLRTLRIPMTNEQREFDEQVLTLAKLFIDSLNEKELEKGLSITKENPKGLDKLEAFLLDKGLQYPKMIEFLRKLQALRSTTAAHRKGEQYEKLKKYFSIGDKDLSAVFEDILVKCIWTLNTLEKNLITKADAVSTNR